MATQKSVPFCNFGSAVIAACALLMAAPAEANILLPGDFGAPDPLILGTGSTQVASTTVSVPFEGSFIESVFRDPTRGGDFTWLIQMTSSPILAISIEASNFTGFSTDVGVYTGSPPTGFLSTAAAIFQVGRTSNGSEIVFSVDQSTTAILEIETNAIAFASGSLFSISQTIRT